MKKQHRYIDLNIAMKPHPMTGDLPRVYDEKAINQSIKTLLLSNTGDYKFRPWMGANIERLLFEQATPIVEHEIKTKIEEIIKNHEPRAIIKSLDVVYDEQNDGYQIDLMYEAVGLTSPLSLKIFLKRAR